MREPPLSLDRRTVLAGSAATGAVLLASTGRAAAERVPTFATDIRLPGLLYAVVARPPLQGMQLARLDASHASSLRGVAGVVELASEPGSALSRLGGVAVLAQDTWTALKARDALSLEWSENAALASDATRGRDFMPETAEPLMEPPSALVQCGGSSCVAWATLRDPRHARIALADRLGIDGAAVTLHATKPAAGPDRATDPAYLFEAARLSRAMRGAPVSLLWTIADDLPFRCRPAALVA